jgi:cyclic dehypoxanthinyl futalosine synthase
MSRLTNKEALNLIKNSSLIELGQLATKKKKELHPKL